LFIPDPVSGSLLFTYPRSSGQKALIPDPQHWLFWVYNTLIWCRSRYGIRDIFDPELKIQDGKIWTEIRYKHPGSATLSVSVCISR
jgi:hypothetical protein